VAGCFPLPEGLLTLRDSESLRRLASKRSTSIVSIELIRTFRLRKQLVGWPILFRRVRSERSESRKLAPKHPATRPVWSGKVVARIGLRMMPPSPPPPLSTVRRVFPSTAGRLAFQVAPSPMSPRLSQHQACPAHHVGLHLPFVHSVASSYAPLCVGTMDSVLHRHSRS
jgi:hypothetical protein